MALRTMPTEQQARGSCPSAQLLQSAEDEDWRMDGTHWRWQEEPGRWAARRVIAAPCCRECLGARLEHLFQKLERESRRQRGRNHQSSIPTDLLFATA